MKLIKNSIQCKRCGDILVSEYTHDFKMCSCGAVSCDGGLSYSKRSFKNSPDDFVELSEYSRNGEDSSEVHKEASGN